MAFTIDETIWRLFPGMQLVVGFGQQLDNTAEHPELLLQFTAAQHRLREGWAHENAQAHPSISAWRDALQRIGVSGKKFPCSIEAMTRRVLNGGAVPAINPLTDFYNTISLNNLVPAGAWDVAGLTNGDITLRVTRGGEPFTELGQPASIPVAAGEVSYADPTEIITRHFVWRQSEKAKVVSATRCFFFVAEVLPATPPETAETVMDDFSAGMRHHFGLKVNATVLQEPDLRWDWE